MGTRSTWESFPVLPTTESSSLTVLNSLPSVPGTLSSAKERMIALSSSLSETGTESGTMLPILLSSCSRRSITFSHSASAALISASIPYRRSPA